MSFDIVSFYAPWLCWVLPMIGAALTPIFAKIGSKLRDRMAVFFGGLAAVMAVLMLPEILHGEVKHQSYTWIPPFAKVGVIVDPLSVVMANIVASISFLILIYSLTYMEGDPSLTRYWFFMNLFIGNMLLLVMSDNLLQMLFGWEGVGLCSYALIGFWHRDSKEDWRKSWVGEGEEAYPPSHCGMKAFVVTRVGDLCLLVAVFTIFYFARTFDYFELFERSGQWAAPLSKAGLLLPVALLFFMGPVGKSAQFPLHEWLPDAMAGPTTVSALIHAATMVKAGVYLMLRSFPIFWKTLWINGFHELTTFFLLVAWIGAFTAFLTATQAMVSKEIKKVLAYSTVSQIGYMMLAIGVGGLVADWAHGYVASLFHLMSHAMFKALLFLGAGSVIHACASRFIHEYGGIRKEMPITFSCMLIGVLSLSGIPPLSGFWSKEAVLNMCLKLGAMGQSLFAVGLITAAITFFYSVRMLGLTFLGKRSSWLHGLEGKGQHVHEAKPVMWVPYALLAVGTIATGLVNMLGTVSLEHWLFETAEKSLELHSPKGIGFSVGSEWPPNITPIASAIMLVLGGLPACYMYVAQKTSLAGAIQNHKVLAAFQLFLANRWYINRFYYKVLVNPLISMSKLVFRYVETLIDKFSYVLSYGTVNGSKSMLGRVELGVMDRFNYTVAGGAFGFSERARKIHTGDLLNYMGQALYGFVAILIFVIIIMSVSGW